MREILHLSFSATANHLSTHFFNAQESYFTYDDTISPVDHNVTFRSGLAADGSTETFTPRCLLWDLKGGFGSLTKYNVLYGNEPESLTPGDVVRIEEPRVPKGAYIESLDQKAKHIPKLTPSTTLYWSDYCNIFHHPRSLLQLSSWEYHPIDAPKGRARGSGGLGSPTAGVHGSVGKAREFRGYDIGVSEFHNRNNEGSAGEHVLETHFRALLEECDLLGGVNVVTDIDSAWGGFTAEALSELRDEYIPKSTILLWGLEDNAILDRVNQYSRIQTVAALNALSTAYVPLCLKPDTTALQSFFSADDGFDPSSLWQYTGLLNAAFESLTLPTRLQESESRVSMDNLVSEVTSFGSRNIVSGIELAVGHAILQLGGTNSVNNGHQDKLSQSRAAKSRLGHVFSKFGIVRDRRGSNGSMEQIWEEYAKATDVQNEGGFVDRRLISLGYPTPSSYPSYFPEAGPLYSALYSTSFTKYQLADMKDFVSRYVRGDEREELKDQLDNLTAEYEFGWSGDSSGDDDE
ncbi:Misato segment II tubulin-like domain-containing protein [Lipomyces tetrasporus]|uniref:Protein DML1 n=1 Tax=Lipomyces tetrasporus TaxID=54092 RepID=A0AAD7QWP6_9ASCO|nr:Misato segment II tubulin-like domain-containing protein [Lipomyces tetrasporus]KAJ8101207.1 Misato segment II tubulin-like domain-containing protein [Lipomyces tetrasporus]